LAGGKLDALLTALIRHANPNGIVAILMEEAGIRAHKTRQTLLNSSPGQNNEIHPYLLRDK
jgi:hypothetical protein